MADDADDVGLAGGRHEPVAGHAHQRAGHHAEVFFHGRPALDRRRVELRALRPLVEHHAELGHLEESFLGYLAGAGIAF